MMDDLVKRLRTPIPMKQSFSGYYPDLTALAALREEAAAALEAKEAEIARLRGEIAAMANELSWDKKTRALSERLRAALQAKE